MNALNGQYDAALEVLEELVDDDWRYYWWGLDFYPEIAPMVDNTRFRALQRRLRNGVREQKQYYESGLSSGYEASYAE